MISTRSLLAAAAASTVLVGGASAYEQLIGLPALNGGDTTSLATGTINGTTGYAMLSGSGLHRIVKIDDLGGSNVVTELVSTSAFNTAAGATPSGLSGQLFFTNGELLLLELGTDALYSIDPGSGAISTRVSNTAFGGNVLFGGIDYSDGNLLVYQSDADSLLKTTGAVDGVNTVLTDLELTTVTGDDTPAGVVGLPSGIIYLGQQTDSAGEDISFYDTSLGVANPASYGDVLTEAQLVGAGNDVSLSNTAFGLVAGQFVFGDLGTNDRIATFDPADPAGTLATVFSEAELLAGPAASDFVNVFADYRGTLAWVQTLSAGGAVPGFYAIPEPASVGLLAIGAALLRRRRTA